MLCLVAARNIKQGEILIAPELPMLSSQEVNEMVMEIGEEEEVEMVMVSSPNDLGVQKKSNKASPNFLKQGGDVEDYDGDVNLDGREEDDMEEDAVGGQGGDGFDIESSDEDQEIYL